MLRKWFWLGSFTSFFVVMAVLGIFIVSPAQAQCGDTPADSSCITCHEYQGADPVYGKGEWHEIHALKDCCWNCHGGNTQAQDKDLAHEGIIAQPLQDVYSDCACCHPEDYYQRAEQFAAALDITPGCSLTPTAVAVAMVQSNPLVILPPPSAPATSFPWPVAILGAVVLVLMISAFIFLGRRKMKEN